MIVAYLGFKISSFYIIYSSYKSLFFSPWSFRIAFPNHFSLLQKLIRINQFYFPALLPLCLMKQYLNKIFQKDFGTLSHKGGTLRVHHVEKLQYDGFLRVVLITDAFNESSHQAPLSLIVVPTIPQSSTLHELRAVRFLRVHYEELSMFCPACAYLRD